MTAEALIEEVKKPLLKVGAKELDYGHPTNTSQQLDIYFKLARQWDAIVLM
jgi:hypothetical protein